MQNIILFLQDMWWLYLTHFDLIILMLVLLGLIQLTYLKLWITLNYKKEWEWWLEQCHELNELYRANPDLITHKVVESRTYLAYDKMGYLKQNNMKIPKWLKSAIAKLEDFPDLP